MPHSEISAGIVTQDKLHSTFEVQLFAAVALACKWLDGGSHVVVLKGYTDAHGLQTVASKKSV